MSRKSKSFARLRRWRRGARWARRKLARAPRAARIVGVVAILLVLVALTIFYPDSAGFAGVMKADDEDNGKALKSLGLAK